MEKEGRLLPAIPYEDCHAFKQPWFVHPHFGLAEAEKIQRDAYRKDFYTLGPSLARLIRTTLQGYLNFQRTDSPPLLARARQIERRLWFYKAALYDMELLADDPGLRAVIREIREEVEAMVGKLTPWEKAVAAGAYVAGSGRKAYNRLFGDVLQPRTTVTRYPADWKPPA
jgi:hypothetical protein